MAASKPPYRHTGFARSVEGRLSSDVLTATVKPRLGPRQNVTEVIPLTIAEFKHTCRIATWRHLMSFDKSNELGGSGEKSECGP